MQIQNNKEEVPFAHYEARFRSLIPEQTAVQCGTEFDGEAFHLTLLGTKYCIRWPEYEIRAESPDAFALHNLPCQTFLLRFLLEGRRAEPFSDYRTFREMPWGEMYIGPYTGRCLTRAAYAFGNRVEAFAKACQALGAQQLSRGDAGYEFELLPGYRMQLMVYRGDEEFPPSAQILYSSNFASAFAAEDRVVAGDILISAVKAAMQETPKEIKGESYGISL